MLRHTPSSVSRREFVRTSAAAAGAAVIPAAAWAKPGYFAFGSDVIKVGLIGCGGRGTGAAANSLAASPKTRIVAMADVFEDRLKGSREYLKTSNDFPADHKARVTVADDHMFTGFDAYKKLLATDVDLVILATPPGFRPIHFAAAVDANKHVFFEKPVAVDPAGVRQVIAAAKLAEQKRLGVVTGTQRRHENCYLEMMKRIQGGAIGKIMSARVSWNQGSLWMHKREPKWSDMEWQLRNWLYFTWLSGDHIVEQHVHNLDVLNWVMGSTPIKCLGLGGRQVRTQPEYGQIYDHFAIEYEYPNGVYGFSTCRQIDNCTNRVMEAVTGTEGATESRSGFAQITGKNPWKCDPSKNNEPYTQEHIDLIASIESGTPLNEGVRVAESTLTAIMGRMSCYTGQEVTWDFAMNKSTLDLVPKNFEMGPLAVGEVAMPGKTKLV